ncbi:MAG: EamA family transporter RarD [Vibrio sp.]
MNNNQTNTSIGVTLNVIASTLFAVMFAYSTLLSELNGEEVYGWRLLFTFPLLTLFIVVNGYWSQVVTLFTRIKTEPYFWATRIFSAILVNFQLWLFLWAPSHGYGLAVSLGYFIVPIVMVIVGWLAFKDRMSRLQKLACFFAVIGVVNQLAISQSLQWPTLAVCLGYPIYFWLRYKTNTNNLGCVWLDMLLSLPFCVYFIFRDGYVLQAIETSYHLLWLVIGLGLISTLALSFQSMSAPYLNLSLFGLLSYVEPVLLVVASVLLGEAIAPSEWPTYIAIWLAVMVLILEGVLSLRKRPQIQ